MTGAFVACGLDEFGLAPSDAGVDVFRGDGGGTDGSDGADAALPPTCATTDVSCLGFDAGVPDGWAPFVLATGNTCPSSDFTATAWVTDAKLSAGACICSCTPSGNWSCPNTMAVAIGAGCGNGPSNVDVGQCQGQGSSHIQLVDAGAVSGNVTCAADASAPTATATPITLCAADCDAGPQALCSQPAGRRCIATDGTQACPPGFTKHIVGAGPTGSCNPCGCQSSSPPACAAVATVYYGSGGNLDMTCTADGGFTTQSIALDGNCQPSSAHYDSFQLNFQTPSAPDCSVNGGGGDAGVTSPKTVCCK